MSEKWRLVTFLIGLHKGETGRATIMQVVCDLVWPLSGLARQSLLHKMQSHVAPLGYEAV